jgi:hypothetical protein
MPGEFESIGNVSSSCDKDRKCAKKCVGIQLAELTSFETAFHWRSGGFKEFSYAPYKYLSFVICLSEPGRSSSYKTLQGGLSYFPVLHIRTLFTFFCLFYPPPPRLYVSIQIPTLPPDTGNIASFSNAVFANARQRLRSRNQVTLRVRDLRLSQWHC